jgi:hypothetical protein
VLETGRPITDAELFDGDRAFLASYSPVHVDGRVLGVICAVVETTDRHHAQEAVGRLLDRTARLQAVSEQLAGALTEQEVAEVILRVGTEATGGTCGVLGLRDSDRMLRIEHRFGMAGGAPGLLPLDAPGADAPGGARRAQRPAALARRLARALPRDAAAGRLRGRSPPCR